MGMEVAKEWDFTDNRETVPLWKNGNFVRLWLAYGLSGLSLSTMMLAQSWYVIRVLGLDTMLGVVLMSATLPRVLLMAWGGVAADRFRRSGVLFWSEMARSGWMVVMIGVLLTGGLNLWTLAGFSFLFGVLDAFFWPAAGSILPALVGKGQLTRANSMMQTTYQLAMVAGPGLAGVILIFGSYTGVFLAIACFLAIAGGLVRGIREPFRPGTGKQPTPWNDLKEGIRYVRNTSFLVTCFWLTFFVNFLFSGPLNIGLPVLVDRYWKGDALDLSALQSGLAAGMVVGALLVGWWNPRQKRLAIQVVLISLLGLLLMALSQVKAVWQGVLVTVMLGVFINFGNVLATSFIQEWIAPDKMGRVVSLMSTASNGLIPLSYGTVSLILSLGVPLAWIWVVAGGTMTLYMGVVLWRVKAVWEMD